MLGFDDSLTPLFPFSRAPSKCHLKLTIGLEGQVLGHVWCFNAGSRIRAVINCSIELPVFSSRKLASASTL